MMRGFAQADCGRTRSDTPTFTRIARSGVTYNAFRAAAICSASRASLLTGRNQHRVGIGVIAELATDWDGYTGEIPKSSATVARCCGATATPPPLSASGATRRRTRLRRWAPSTAGPPATALIASMASWAGNPRNSEPRALPQHRAVEPPHDPGLPPHRGSGEASDRLAARQRGRPERPFLMYWAPGAVQAAPPGNKAWADKYKEQVRRRLGRPCERAFARQKQLGWIPR